MQGKITVIDLWPMETDCGVCGKRMIIRNGGYSLPMYENRVVNPDKHEWAGYPVCDDCYKKHEHLMYV